MGIPPGWPRRKTTLLEADFQKSKARQGWLHAIPAVATSQYRATLAAVAHLLLVTMRDTAVRMEVRLFLLREYLPGLTSLFLLDPGPIRTKSMAQNWILRPRGTNVLRNVKPKIATVGLTYSNAWKTISLRLSRARASSMHHFQPINRSFDPPAVAILRR